MEEAGSGIADCLLRVCWESRGTKSKGGPEGEFEDSTTLLFLCRADGSPFARLGAWLVVEFGVFCDMPFCGGWPVRVQDATCEGRSTVVTLRARAFCKSFSAEAHAPGQKLPRRERVSRILMQRSASLGNLSKYRASLQVLETYR